MSVRNTSYADYNISRDEEKHLLALCKSKDIDTQVKLLRICNDVNCRISNELYISLSTGMSYEWLTKGMDIYYSKGDFYGYRRKCLYEFKNTIKNEIFNEINWCIEKGEQ